MSGFPCLNMKLRRAIIAKICQDACACTFHILAETLYQWIHSPRHFYFLQASTLFIKNISAVFFPLLESLHTHFS